jgi:hypothetical protein
MNVPSPTACLAAAAHNGAVVIERKVMLLLERVETVAAIVYSAVGTVRNEDDGGESSLTCLEEANDHLMQSVNGSIDRSID